MQNDIEAALDRKLAHLKVKGLSAGYGNFLVLRDLTLEARPGLTVILGPNGAGKTTLLKALMGLIPRQGEVRLDDRVIDADAKTDAIVKQGMALVPIGPAVAEHFVQPQFLQCGHAVPLDGVQQHHQLRGCQMRLLGGYVDVVVGVAGIQVAHLGLRYVQGGVAQLARHPRLAPVGVRRQYVNGGVRRG